LVICSAQAMSQKNNRSSTLVAQISLTPYPCCFQFQVLPTSIATDFWCLSYWGKMPNAKEAFRINAHSYRYADTRSMVNNGEM